MICIRCLASWQFIQGQDNVLTDTQGPGLLSSTTESNSMWDRNSLTGCLNPKNFNENLMTFQSLKEPLRDCCVAFEEDM